MMITIEVKLTEDENKALSIVASQRDAALGELLAAFAADLTLSVRSGGDERSLASDWLYRQTYRWIDGELC